MRRSSDHQGSFEYPIRRLFVRSRKICVKSFWSLRNLTGISTALLPGPVNFETIQSFYISSRGFETSRYLPADFHHWKSYSHKMASMYQTGAHNFDVMYHSMMDNNELVLRYDTLMRLQWSLPITWSRQIGRLSINWGPFHFSGIYCNWNAIEKPFYSHPNSNWLSSKKVAHFGSVVASLNLCTDMITILKWITA